MTSSNGQCVKHGAHPPGVCPHCEELAEAREIVATPDSLTVHPVIRRIYERTMKQADGQSVISSARARLRDIASWHPTDSGSVSQPQAAALLAKIDADAKEREELLRLLTMRVRGQAWGKADRESYARLVGDSDGR